MPPRARKSAKITTPPLPDENVDDALAVINSPEAIAPILDDGAQAIPAALQFTTAAADEDSSEVSDAEVLPFTVDGTVLHAIKPTPEQWGVLMGMISGASTITDRIFGMQQFASHVLDESSYLYVQSRLLDRTDRFGTEVYSNMLTAIIDAFAPKLNREESRRAARASHR
ncbi:hypothetical protein GFY24_00690 [Nocardia sp. SYP-A9097]|uniref:hypothetical protein n=1 Tax=Nocardia sp. SYP-A9097 TaxID=2663237 RepID=UPI00129C04F0|nr:hypothetical protein [Nocardia sp. SYP-A9097]MRH85994.1 hypothetical protein [Nocardia sp. SYP-A9097]